MEFRIFITSLFLAFSSFQALAERSSTCRHRIFFLPQSHAADALTGAQLTQSELDLVAASQLRVAQFLERFPDLPVFTEQAAAQNFSWNMVSADQRSRIKNMYDRLFPRGLPSSPYELSEMQRKKLIDNGGDFVQLIRGKTSILRKVVENEEELNRIFNPIKQWFSTNPPRDIAYPPEIGRLVYGARERAALSQINNYFVQNPQQKHVILIYGANHNFQFYSDLFPPHCIHVPSEFLPHWDGRYRAGAEGFHPAAISDKLEASAGLR